MRASVLWCASAAPQRSHLSRISSGTESVPLHQRVDAHVRVRTFAERLRAAVAQESLRDASRETERSARETGARAQAPYAESLELRRIGQSRPGEHVERQREIAREFCDQRFLGRARHENRICAGVGI